MSISKEIGELFKEAREKRNLTVQEASRKSRIHFDVIIDIENGVFERLHKLYVKSFLKKYSKFLSIDTKKIEKQYESIFSKMPDTPVALVIGSEKEEEDFSTILFIKKNLRIILTIAISVIALSLLLILISMIRSKTTAHIKQTEPVVSSQIESRVIPVSNIKAPVALTLKASGEVWIQVTEGEHTLFAGILKKGESRTWKTEDALIVWTGKADMLNFTLNEHEIGKVAAGVVKNIKVSQQGIKIGNAWVIQTE